ncbi:MAG: SUMF1/EgtB/PvdO family nonheme iron enzyme [Bernardetiaceae bacterium]|nr:SUMF1/EgtB/PvdO family nonheme iron enzyme [Bernardetiaceae bacterium]
MYFLFSFFILPFALSFFVDGSPMVATATTLHQPISHALADTSKMIFVEGGTYYRGDYSFEDEMPVHEVEVSSFYIDKYEVTVGEYKQYCESVGKEMPNPPAWGWKDSLPMTNLNWHDAVAYAQWCNKRLPTEAEWEYAARGGLKAQKFPYAGDKYPTKVAWFDKNSAGSPQRVGLRQPNELGIYDMSGNVWEWCYDRYGPYQNEKQINPRGAEHGLNRVLRGGCWFTNQGTLRVANRYYHPESFGSNTIGFRLVVDAE